MSLNCLNFKDTFALATKKVLTYLLYRTISGSLHMINKNHNKIEKGNI